MNSKKIINTFTTKPHINHIDVAARIFYPRLFDLCQENLEKMMANSDVGEPVDWIYRDKKYPVIVHCEADFIDPILLNESLIICIRCTYIGVTSFHLEYEFKHNNKVKALAKTIHVFTDNGIKKIDLPKRWKKVLNQLEI